MSTDNDDSNSMFFSILKQNRNSPHNYLPSFLLYIFLPWSAMATHHHAITKTTTSTVYNNFYSDEGVCRNISIKLRVVSADAASSRTAGGRAEVKLSYKTGDTISSVRFSPNSNQYLLISSWDSHVTLFDIQSNKVKTSYDHEGWAVLDSCFRDRAHSYSGSIDGKIRMYDFYTCIQTVIGQHDMAVRATEFARDSGLLLTGSWDGTVKMWDPRSKPCVRKLTQPDKVYSLALIGDGEKFIVGTAHRKVAVWDMRNPSYILQRRESSLKYQTRCIKAFPNKQGFVLSSIEGRVAVEFLDSNPEVQKKKYAFKCHRIKEDGLEKIFPVNTLSFHPKYNTFASGGSDGFVNIWDGYNKKRLCQFHRYPLSITSVNFSSEGNCLAIACSPLIPEDDLGDKPIEGSVFLRFITDHDTKPKILI